jgi:hypothetical protein
MHPGGMPSVFDHHSKYRRSYDGYLLLLNIPMAAAINQQMKKPKHPRKDCRRAGSASSRYRSREKKTDMRFIEVKNDLPGFRSFAARYIPKALRNQK